MVKEDTATWTLLGENDTEKKRIVIVKLMLVLQGNVGAIAFERAAVLVAPGKILPSVLMLQKLAIA